MYTNIMFKLFKHINIFNNLDSLITKTAHKLKHLNVSLLIPN